MTRTTGFPCPECGAWTEVKATRREVRTRECGNGHRFYTQEVVFKKPPRGPLFKKRIEDESSK
jgi:hypothetical protein